MVSVRRWNPFTFNILCKVSYDSFFAGFISKLLGMASFTYTALCVMMRCKKIAFM